MSDSTHKQGARKPSKPYPEFPLFPHATRRWAKKIRGRLYYFGPWTDEPDCGATAALARYQEVAGDLHAGRRPRTRTVGLTIRDVANRFLTAKKLLVDSGELEPRTFADYYATCERVIDCFGANCSVQDLRGEDFQELRATFAKNWGPVTLGNEIQRVRVLFKYALDEGIIEQPVKYGASFKRPSKKTLRKERNRKGKRMFEAGQLRLILDAAAIPMKAMIMLGINCAFANTDVATLTQDKVQTIGKQTLDFPAVDLIMGHAPRADDMSDPYREEISDKRLLAVVNYVRRWFFEKTHGWQKDGAQLSSGNSDSDP